MSNNTSNYQEYTFSKLLEQYDIILVPMIQRDYAQGRTDKKATDVRNNLLNDIFCGKDVHFDLVFGSKEKRIIDGKEMNCFIPVDGQQRLTTLFLLFLYGLKAGKTNIELDLSKFSYDTRRAASDFCESITSVEWTVQEDKKVSDVIKDSSWFMNYWEKDPTVEGMLNMLDAIHEKCKEITDYPNLNKVTFFFFDLESNGLNENLYLKMNSRGKPLTAFENLKAKMEKVLPDNIKSDDAKIFFPENAVAQKTFKDKWKFFMDRDWINAFWNSEKPEETDINITAFIVRFLSGYYNAFNEDNNENNISEELKEINNKENYADFIPFEPIEKILKLEKTFQTLAYALTIIPSISQYWSEDPIKITEKSEYKFLAVIFSYVLFDGDKSAMRFAWNMAENTVSGYDNFIAYCKRMKEISDIYKKERNIYKVLVDSKFDNTSEQLKEEIAKAKQILRPDGKTWENIIIKAEKYEFFKGAIRFLFTKEDIGDDWEHFDTKWENAQKYFDNNGVKEMYQTNACLLRYYISKFNEWWMFWDFPYDNKPTTWKSLLTSNRLIANHSILMQTPENLALSNFNAHLDKYDDSYKDLQNNVQNDLVKTTILVEASKWSSKLNWHNNTYCLYPYNAKADWKKYVIGNYRNHILSRLCDSKQIVVEGDRRFQSGDSKDFFWGWDINLKYNSNEFQWNTDGKVYLIENNNRKQKEDGSDYGFPVDGIIDSDDFKDKLDRLIDEVAKGGDL